jgi:hypothetical protein
MRIRLLWMSAMILAFGKTSALTDAREPNAKGVLAA